MCAEVCLRDPVSGVAEPVILSYPEKDMLRRMGDTEKCTAQLGRESDGYIVPMSAVLILNALVARGLVTQRTVWEKDFQGRDVQRSLYRLVANLIVQSSLVGV